MFLDVLLPFIAQRVFKARCAGARACSRLSMMQLNEEGSDDWKAAKIDAPTPWSLEGKMEHVARIEVCHLFWIHSEYAQLQRCAAVGLRSPPLCARCVPALQPRQPARPRFRRSGGSLLEVRHFILKRRRSSSFHRMVLLTLIRAKFHPFAPLLVHPALHRCARRRTSPPSTVSCVTLP